MYDGGSVIQVARGLRRVTRCFRGRGDVGVGTGDRLPISLDVDLVEGKPELVVTDDASDLAEVRRLLCLAVQQCDLVCYQHCQARVSESVGFIARNVVEAPGVEGELIVDAAAHVIQHASAERALDVFRPAALATGELARHLERKHEAVADMFVDPRVNRYSLRRNVVRVFV